MDLKVYGPYKRADGRMHVVLYDGITRRTQSYPRFLMEEYLGRFLEDWEHVDHINEDFTDNRIENLQIVSSAFNNLKTSVEGKNRTKWHYFHCSICGIYARIPLRQYKHNNVKQGKAGPFCGKSCAREYQYRKNGK